MSIQQQVYQHIQGLPAGQAFSARTLRSFGSADSIWQALSRLVKHKKLKRVARGIYIRPKITENFGELPLSTQEIITAIAKNTGETIAIHGAEAARQLQLSTQAPIREIYYTTGYTRHISIGNRTIKLQHVSPSKIVAPGTLAGKAIHALWYLGKSAVTAGTMKKIKKRIGEAEFNQLNQYVALMPVWMAEAYSKERNTK
ncbi:MAG: hypothetical protein DHS20C10_12500 [marine bacterium B5-7]|nr:MAG: hypothetical protein DHS20C10_12500 [marine bacterium B5-7]